VISACVLVLELLAGRMTRGTCIHNISPNLNEKQTPS